MSDLVVGIGEILWDMLPTGKKLGGAPANFAYHVSQLGLDALVVSAVGRDALGDGIKESLDAKHLKHHIATVGYPTGTVAVSVDDKGVPVYDITRDVAWDHIGFTADLQGIAGQARAVCFGSLAQRSQVSRETICRFIDAMPDNPAVLKVFDINIRQSFYTPQVIEHSLRMANVLKLNEDELQLLRPMLGVEGEDAQGVCRELVRRYGLRALILTCGDKASYVFTSDNMSVIETPKVTLADTVGAGDSFTASFVSAILRGASVHEAHRLAVDVSAYVCTCHGAMPLLPDDLRHRL